MAAASSTNAILAGVVKDPVGLSGAAGSLVLGRTGDTGTVNLNAANTYTGPTIINAGTAKLGIANAIPGSSVLSVNSGATLSRNGFTDTIAGLSITAGTISGTGTLNLGGDVSATGVATNDATITGGTLGLAAVAGTTNRNFTVTRGATGSTADLTIADAITDGFLANASLTLASGSTGIMSLTNTANTYTGGTFIKAGTLILGSAASNGLGTGLITIGDTTGSADATFSTPHQLTLAHDIVAQAGTSGTLTVVETGASSQALTLGGSITLGSNGSGQSLTLAATSGASVTVAGIVRDPAGLAGSPGSLILGSPGNTGTIILSAMNNYNNYAGGTILNAGTVNISSDANLGNSAGRLTFNGGTLRTTAGITTSRPVTLNSLGGTINTNGFNSTFSGVIGGGGSLTKTGGGTLTLAGANAYAGSTIVSGGTLQYGADGALPGTDVGLSSGTTLDLNNHAGTIGTLLGSGNVTLGSGALNLAGDGSITTYSGIISGSGSLTIGANCALVLSGANTFTGNTVINNGTVVLANKLALQGSTVQSYGYSGLLSFGTLTSATLGGLTGNQSMVLTNDNSVDIALTVGANNQSTAYYGELLDYNHKGSLIKAGSGTFVFAGYCGYGGGTTVSGGTLTTDTYALQGNISTASGTVVNFDQSYTIYYSYGTYAGNISGSGSVAISFGSVTFTGHNTYSGGTVITSATFAEAVGDTNSLQGNISVDSNSDVQFNQGFSGTYSGVVSGSGSINLTVTNNATLTLSKSQTTTGFVYVNSDGIVGDGTVTIPSGGGLKSSASIGIDNGGTLDLKASNLLNPAGEVFIGFNPSVLSLNGNSETVGTVDLVGGSITGTGTLTASSFDLQSGTISVNLAGTGAALNAGTHYPGAFPSDTVTLSGVNSYTGATLINNTLVLTSTGSIKSSSAVTITEYGTLNLQGSNQLGSAAPVTIGSFFDGYGPGGALALNGNSLQVGAVTLAYGSINGPGTLTASSYNLQSGAVSANLAGAGATLTKNAANNSRADSVTLSGANSYTGATAINSGSLMLANPGSLGATAITVSSGTALATSGVVSAGPSGVSATFASLTLNNGSTLAMTSGNTMTLNANTTGSPGTVLSIGNASGGASLSFNLTGTPGSNDELVVANGTATVAGANTVNVSDLSATLSTSSPYTLISVPGGGLNGGTFQFANGSATENFVTGSGRNYNLSLANSSTSLAVTAVQGTDYWIGNNGNHNWDTASRNWSTASGGGRNVVFGTGDAVVFDNNANGSAFTVTVNQPGNVSPASMTFSNSSHVYTVSNTMGVIAGMGTLAISGAGVTISGANTFSGGSSVTNYGALYLASSTIGSAGSVTSGPVGTGTIALGTPGGNDICVLAFAGGTSGLSVANAIATASGNTSFELTIANDATSGTNTFTGNVTVNSPVVLTTGGGELDLTGAISGGGGITVTGSGPFGIGPGTVKLSGANTYTGGTAIISGTLQLGDGTTSNGSVTGNIIDNATLAFANPSSQTYSGAIGGNGAVIKSAAGALILSGSSSYAGGTTVNGGSLAVQSGGILSAQGNLSVGTSGVTGQSGVFSVDGASSFTQSSAATVTIGAAAVSTGTLNVGTSTSGAVFTSGSGAITINATGTVNIGSGTSITGTFNANGNVTINGGVLQRVNNASAFNLASGKMMTITGGGRASFTGSGGIGGYFTAPNVIYNVAGANSRLETLGNCTFDINSASQVNVSSGGALASQYEIDIGAGAGTSGTLSVDGAGSSASATASGGNNWGEEGGAANVTFSNGATGTFSALYLGHGFAAGSVGTLNIQSGASASFSSMYLGDLTGAGQSATINITGAGSQLTMNGGSTLTLGNASTGASAINVGTTVSGGTFNTGTGAIAINSTGTVGIGSGANTGTFNANGNVTLNGGVLNLGNAGSTFNLAGGKSLTIQSGGKLTGTGFVSGSIDVGAGGIIAPGSGSPGAIHLGATTCDDGGDYQWEINNWTGSQGTNYDFQSITGNLTINATSGSPFPTHTFKIDIRGLTASNVLGNIPNFDNTQTRSWTIAEASSGISGFAANKFTIDPSGISNNLNGGTFSLSTANAAGSVQDLVLTFTPGFAATTYNLVASAAAANIHVAGAGGVTTSTITSTITNASTGTADALDYTALGASTNGGALGNPSTLPKSGGPLANSGGSDSGTVTFSSTSAGSFTITPTVATATNHNLGGNATLGTTTPASVNVWRLASANAIASPGNLGNFHLGDSAQAALVVTNTAAGDGYSENLDATLGGPTGLTHSGSISGLAPQASDNHSLLVGIDTTTAGAKSGSIAVNLVSNGLGTSGLGTTPIATQLISASGTVYRLAAPSGHSPEPVNLGVVHVGESFGTQSLTISNTAANDGYSEKLDVGFGPVTGAATASGSVFLLAPQATDSSSLSVGLGGNAHTGVPGAVTGSTYLAQISDGFGTSGLLTAIGAQGVSVTGQVNYFAQPQFTKSGGAGTLTGGGGAYTLDFGPVAQNSGTYTANLSVLNNLLDGTYQDNLSGTFGTGGAPHFSTSGFGAFSGVVSGGSQGNLQVSFDSSVNHAPFNESLTLHPASVNASGSSSRPYITLNLVVSQLALSWTGQNGGTGGSNRNWTTGSSDTNWYNGLSPAAYQDGSAVTFGDTNAAAGGARIYDGTVNIQSAGVRPASLTFANSNVDYYLLHGGAITGSTGILKSGSARLLLFDPNSFTGLVQIAGGTISVNNGGALGNSSGVTVASGATLELYDSSSTPVSIGNIPLSLAGALTNGYGAYNYYNGPITIQGNTATIYSNPGILHITGGIDTAGNQLMFDGRNGNANIIVSTGAIRGSGGLAKIGNGTLTLSVANTYSGGTAVNSGVLATTADGALGSGPLAVNSTGDASIVNLGGSESVSGLSGTVSGGSATINVAAGKTLTVNQASGSTTFAGNLVLAAGNSPATGAVLAKSGEGTEILAAPPQFGAHSALAVDGGTLRINVSSDSFSVGSGVSATVSDSGTLELAGAVSALAAGSSRVNIINGSDAPGLLVSGNNQQVGGIDGTGTTQINAGSDLTANHIVQGALVISGLSGSLGYVTIDASDASGNPLNLSSGFAVAGSLTPSGPFGAGGISSANLSSGGSGDPAALSLGNSAGGANPSSVPEPSTLLLVLVAIAGLAGKGIASRRRARRDSLLTRSRIRSR